MISGGAWDSPGEYERCKTDPIDSIYSIKSVSLSVSVSTQSFASFHSLSFSA